MPNLNDIKWGKKDEQALLPNGAIRRTCSAADAARIKKVISDFYRWKVFSRRPETVEATKEPPAGESIVRLGNEDAKNNI